MNWYVIARMLGLIGLLIGGSMIFSLPWAFPIWSEVTEFESAGFWGIVGAMVCSLLLGGGLYLIGRRRPAVILRKEALATVGLGWVLAGVLGALPFLLSGTERRPGVPMSTIDAIFESISGFTTTGASVLAQLEDPRVVPRSVLFWRSFTHWLGGMGIIVLFVAILGQLGAGGKAMLKREVPGPLTESVRPRVRETAVTMWTIYVVLSCLEAALLMVFGIAPFHALCHTFGTMATGGFSTYNDSAAHFNGGPVEATVVIFMILAGMNFSLFDQLVRRRGTERLRRRLRQVLRDPECRAYLGLLLGCSIAMAISLTWNGNYATWPVSLRHSVFASVSIMTTTGYGTEDFARWTEFSKALLFLQMFIGGCAGSTAGGIKVIRCVLIAKVAWMEIERAYRPNVVRPLKLGGAVLPETVRRDVLVYFCLITIVFALGWLMLLTVEPDVQWKVHPRSSTSEKLLDCASAVAATLNNVGPGLGIVGPTENYSGFSSQGKMLLTLLMLLGRLELFAILVLLTPRFWRTQ